MAIIQSLSPAKINLMLRILSQRDDGYHNLQSCFQLLPWGDDMSFKTFTDSNSTLSISGFQNIETQDNLIYRAAELLRPYIQLDSGIEVDVVKRIPRGAGLGGGSSNAAMTLVTLNQIWGCRLTRSALQELALKLGADVPFFVHNKSALATGVGEELKPMHFYEGFVLLLFPNVSISTQSVFSHAKLNRQQSPIGMELIKNPDFWINDCFPLVLREYPEVYRIFTRLNPLMRLRLSGTGSTLFALFKDKIEAENKQKIASEYCRSHLIEI